MTGALRAGLAGLLHDVRELPAAVRWHVDRVRFQWGLRDLPDWDAAHRDPLSGVWRLAPPFDGETWTLFAPGAGRDEDGFIDCEPTAVRPVDPAAPEYERLRDAERWLRPWIGRVAGGHVTELTEGWVVYGPEREWHEYAIYARVEPLGGAS